MKGFCGFTLMERIIAFATIGVVTAFAVPSTGVYVKNSRLTILSNTLVSDLNVAPGEAVSIYHNMASGVGFKGNAFRYTHSYFGKLITH